LESLANRFPALAKIGSIGNSKEGRSLAFIKISSNVERRSPLEPMFKVSLLDSSLRLVFIVKKRIYIYSLLEICMEMKQLAENF